MLLDTLAPRSRSLSVPAVAAAVLVHAVVIVAVQREAWWASEPAGSRKVLIVDLAIPPSHVAAGIEEPVAAAPALPDLLWFSVDVPEPFEFTCGTVFVGGVDEPWQVLEPEPWYPELLRRAVLAGEAMVDAVADAFTFVRDALLHPGRLARRWRCGSPTCSTR